MAKKNATPVKPAESTTKATTPSVAELEEIIQRLTLENKFLQTFADTLLSKVGALQQDLSVYTANARGMLQAIRSGQVRAAPAPEAAPAQPAPPAAQAA